MRVIIAVTMVGLCAAPLAAQTRETSLAIVATALNYVDGWYASDGDRMARAVHSELAKHIVNTDSAGRSRIRARLGPSDRARIRNRQIGFIFQAFNLIGDLTVAENVELPLTYHGLASAERKKRVQDALEKVGMAHRMKHYPSQLSGGQRQRVAVARAVAGEPVILLADEPTGNLDSKNGESVMDLLRDLHRAGATICMVTHDPRYAAHADRAVHPFDGRVVDEQVEQPAS